MDITTTMDRASTITSHYIGEYAIPMLMLATWAEDRAMRQRGQMMLDWIFAELATVTLDGVSARTQRPDRRSHRWSSGGTHWPHLSAGFSSATRHPRSTTAAGACIFGAIGQNYDLPEVIYQIAVNRH